MRIKRQPNKTRADKLCFRCGKTFDVSSFARHDEACLKRAQESHARKMSPRVIP